VGQLLARELAEQVSRPLMFVLIGF